MANFSPSEQRRRHAFIEATIENYLDVLQKNDSENGHVRASRSKQHSELASNLVVPNLRSGTLHLGKIALRNEEHIPIWAANIGENVHVSAELGVSPPSQVNQIRTALTQKEVSDVNIDEVLRFPKYPYEVLIDQSTSALVSDNPTVGEADDGSFSYVQGRPLVILNMQNHISGRTKANFDRTSPDALHHEIVHVTQSLSNPVHFLRTMGDFEDLSIAEEIEAYLHHAIIVNELKRQQYTPSANEYHLTDEDYARLEAIQRVTKKHNRRTAPRSIKPTAPLVRAFRRLGLASMVLDSQMSEQERKQPFAVYEE